MPQRSNAHDLGEIVRAEDDDGTNPTVTHDRASVGLQVLDRLDTAGRLLRLFSARELVADDLGERSRFAQDLLDLARALRELRGADELEALMWGALADPLTELGLDRTVLAPVEAHANGSDAEALAAIDQAMTNLLGERTAAADRWERGGDPEDPERVGGHAGLAGVGEAWDPPVPLRSSAPPPFPTACFPEVLREYVEALARETQTPAALPGLVVLAVVSTACAGRVEVMVRTGWREPVNLFAAVVLPAGNLKSAVFADATRPLAEFQAEEGARLGPEIRRSAARRKVAEKVLERAQADAAKLGDPAERAAALAEVDRAAMELDQLSVTVAPRLWLDDTTPEKLAAVMAEQGQRAALLSPEGGLFGLMAGRYTTSGGPNLDVFLKGHAGDRLAVDRVSREPLLLERPALTVGLAVQPSVIHALQDVPEFRGRGLLARFLWAMPESLVGARDLDAPHVTEPVRRAYNTMIRALLSIPPPDVPHVLRLAPGAADELRQLRGWIEPRLGLAGELGLLADWASKLAGAVARTAGLLHMVVHAYEPAPWVIEVSQDTMAAAVTIGRHLVPHAQAAFGLMGADPALDDAEAVLAWLARDRPERLTIRDAMRARRSLQTGEQALAAVKILLERGYLRPEVRERRAGPGRPSGEAWLVSPFVRSREPGTVGQKGQKGGGSVLSVTCPAFRRGA